ncbi:MAG: DNA primase [Anaerolineales bacterium]|nr:DNA primase [Anaerolineales bacterium]MCB9127599.1 DNA primase [Ardenticatenales bacterium]
MTRSDQAIEEIKQRLDLVSYIGRHVDLKRAGRTYKARCPFHTENTPSFVVFPHSNTWRCFGACGEGGDIFSYVQKREGLDFVGALRLLAREAGVTLEEETESQKNQRLERERLQALCDAAAVQFQQWLTEREDAAPCRAYVEARGLSAEVVDRFALGYAPDSWEALLSALSARGYEVADMQRLGLVREREAGGYYDYFRDRLIFPIRDERGRTVGFGARALQDDQTPKYVNSPQSPLFDKGRTLYGLDLAKESIRRQDQGILVEGYLDVIAAHQHDHPNVVAALGTALTTGQLSLLRRYSTNLVLALDADEAGQRAAERGLETALDLQRYTKQQRWTRAAQGRAPATAVPGELRIATMPLGKDPDDLLRQAPEQWEALIANAQPVIDYMMTQRVRTLDLSDAAQKTQAVADLLPMIADLESSVMRDHYLQRAARLLHVDERALARELSQISRRPRRAPAPAEAPPEMPPMPNEDDGPPLVDEGERLYEVAPPEAPLSDDLESYLLYMLIEYPELLVVAQQEGVSAASWQWPIHRELYAAVESHPPLSGAHLEEFVAQLEAPLARQVRRIVAHYSDRQLPEGELRQLEAFRVVQALLMRQDERDVRQIQQLIDDAQSASDPDGDEIRLLFQQKIRIEQDKRQRQLRIEQRKHDQFVKHPFD